MTRATGSSAVMAARAPDQVEADDPQTALYRQLEFFPTPPWAARAGAELVRFLDPEACRIWEPACGQGHMVGGLMDYGFMIRASDIHSFGFGEVLDFLQEQPDEEPSCDWIFTNPPFKTAAEFVRLGLKRARRGVALLLRIQFLEGGERYQVLHGPEPLTTVAVFAERVPMTLGRWDPKSSTATGYAWFVWMKGAKPRPLMGIQPGAKRRLTRPDDASRWGARSEALLLDRMGDAPEGASE
jgi:hypothetical protein